MIIACTALDCPAVIDIPGPVSPSATFTCRRHTELSTDDVRFQTYQFDDRLLGSGTDPRAYEDRVQPRKGSRKFPKIGRPRKTRLEKLKLDLEGTPNSVEILRILMQDHDTDGPHGG